MDEKNKVLVADDNEEFCRNVADIIELKGYEVEIAHNGSEAVDSARRNSYAFILMDVKMPLLNGVEAFRKIKKISPDTAVIMITAYEMERSIKETLQEGAFGFLKKPLNFDRLFDVIENAVSGRMLVLVADDDEAFCKNIRDVLSDKVYSVTMACNGETALEKARENDFDVLLLDMKLPPFNGLYTYLSVRDIRREIVAILVTGYPKEMSGPVKQALEESAYICLEKPVNMEYLISLLDGIREQRTRGGLGKRDRN